MTAIAKLYAFTKNIDELFNEGVVFSPSKILNLQSLLNFKEKVEKELTILTDIIEFVKNNEDDIYIIKSTHEENYCSGLFLMGTEKCIDKIEKQSLGEKFVNSTEVTESLTEISFPDEDDPYSEISHIMKDPLFESEFTKKISRPVTPLDDIIDDAPLSDAEEDIDELTEVLRESVDVEQKGNIVNLLTISDASDYENEDKEGDTSDTEYYGVTKLMEDNFKETSH